MNLQVREEGEKKDRFYFYPPPNRNKTGSPLVEAETHVMSCWPTGFWGISKASSSTSAFCGMDRLKCSGGSGPIFIYP